MFSFFLEIQLFDWKEYISNEKWIKAQTLCLSGKKTICEFQYFQFHGIYLLLLHNLFFIFLSSLLSQKVIADMFSTVYLLHNNINCAHKVTWHRKPLWLYK